VAVTAAQIVTFIKTVAQVVRAVAHMQIQLVLNPVA
jgi:hypothetical protein